MSAEDTYRRMLEMPFPPSRMILPEWVLRDILVWGFLEEGWTEGDAAREADRRVAELLEAQAAESEAFEAMLRQVFGKPEGAS